MPSSEENSRAPRRDGPVFLRGGFRVFFPLAGLTAALALPLWLALLTAGWEIPSALPAPMWHAHEMIFGFLSAVIAGFLLTAIPNWTGRLPVAGAPLALLALIWIAGRAAMFAGAAWPLAAAVLDATFLVVLATLGWREVIAGGNARNAPVCAILTLFALANAGWHACFLADLPTEPAMRTGLSAVALLMALIGGRVTPSFTRNWIARQAVGPEPAPFAAFDRVALGVLLAALIAWIFAPEHAATGALFALAALLHAVRLARWRGWTTTAEPLVTVLHAGYFWLPLWFALMAASILAGAPDASTALHALTAGAGGVMTLAVMSRAVLGHAGRALSADRVTVTIYGLVFLGAALRVAAPALPFDYLTAVVAAGLLWSAGFALFCAHYGPIAWGFGRPPSALPAEPPSGGA